MDFQRRKCRILLTWIILVALLQLFIYALLFAEFGVVPRKRLAHKLSLENLHSSNIYFPMAVEVQKVKVDRFMQRIPSNLNDRGMDFKSATRKKILSRKIGKFQLSKDTLAENVMDLKQQNINRGKVSRPRNVVEFVAKKVTRPGDIMVSVKTTSKNHGTRLEEMWTTWWNLAKKQIYLFTDADDPVLNERLDGHLINTNCKAGHQRAALCCKMQSELMYFWEKMKKRWFCHFDDDNYVNFPALVKLLQQYNHSQPFYIGKASLSRKMKTWDKLDANKEVKFWFATGGAGFCLSHELVSQMVPYLSDGGFVKQCARTGLPDDCTVGFLSEYLLNVKLTKIDLFHSHLEWLEDISQREFKDQISFSYGYLGNERNQIQLKGLFDTNADPNRFKSLHCFLYPETEWCHLYPAKV